MRVIVRKDWMGSEAGDVAGPSEPAEVSHAHATIAATMRRSASRRDRIAAGSISVAVERALLPTLTSATTDWAQRSETVQSVQSP